MRKLLLASATALGLTAAAQGGAHAQATVGVDGAVSSPVTQAPGTIVVRLNGRVYSQAGLWNIGDANGSVYLDATNGKASALPFLGGPSLGAPPTVNGVPTVLPQFYGNAAQARTLGYRPTSTAAGPQNVVVVPNQPGVNKNSNYAIYSYVRLYPGFDGVAANGLRYGASVEIRQDGSWPAGGGAYGSVSTLTNREGLLYVRRGWGYVGTQSLGIVRFGATDGPSDLFMVGNNENFGDGGLNGSAFAYLPVNLWYYWPYADGGNQYSRQKVVYLSPAFKGFDFGAAFSPTTAGPMGASATQGCNAGNAGASGGLYGQAVAGPGIAGAGCAALSSTNTPDYLRTRNAYDVALRYRGLFGPIGFAAFVDYVGSGVVANTAPNRADVDGWSIGSGGAQVTYGGLTIGAMARGGRVNGAGGWSTVTKGADSEVDYEFGGSYTYGPFIVGAHYSRTDSAGASSPGFINRQGIAVPGSAPSVGQRREQGVSVGATYSVAPGLAINLTYNWAERRESGYDLLTNEAAYAANALNNFGCGPSGIAGSTAACRHNVTNVSMIVLGAQLTW